MSQRSFTRAQQRKQAEATRREALRRRRAGLAAGAVIGAGALLAPGAQAATFFVNSADDTSIGSCGKTCTLRDAVAAANANGEADTIVFVAGLTGPITLGSPLVLTAPEGLTLDGSADDGLITIQGDSSRILDVQAGPLTVTALTLSGGTIGDNTGGGAIRSLSGAAVTLTDDVLTNNQASAPGGAIAVGGPLSVTRSRITGNTVTSNNGFGGGAIAITGTGTTDIVDSDISDNAAKYGAGISDKGSGQLTITGTTMNGNTAGKYGAAIASTAPTTITGATAISNNSGKYGDTVRVSKATTISDSTLSGNAGTANGGNGKYSTGGAVRNTGGTLTVTGSTLTGNHASNGGAIYADGPLQLSDSELSDNDAGRKAGAVLAKGDLAIDGSTFTGNSAPTGGALVGNGRGTVTGSSFSENTASEDGGAVAGPGSLTVDGSTLSKNMATGDGGAVNVGGDLTITGSSLTSNTAENGGAIAGSGTLKVDGSTLSQNTANAGGGAVFPAGDTRITGSLLKDNTAVGGGALAVASGFTAATTVSQTSISGNTATGGGGGVLVSALGGSGSVTVSRSTIAGNQAGADGAPARGGGVQITGDVAGSVRISESTISGNQADAGAGVDAGDPTGAGALTEDGGSVSLDNSTVAANAAATSGGGLRLETENGSASTGTVALNSTIVAGNTAAGAAQDLARAAAPDGADPAAAVTGGVESRFSLIQAPGDVPVTQFASKPSILGADPQLGPLADNGGPTLTQLPAGTSPVVDQGHAPADEETDQRGSARPVNTAVPNATGGDGTDIGAVELAKDAVPAPVTQPPAPTPPAPPTTTPVTPAPPATTPVRPPAPQQFTATVSGSSLTAGVRGTRRLVIANLPGVTCAVSSGRITTCSLTLRSTGALRIAGTRTVLPKGTVLATGRKTATGATRGLLVKVNLTKAGAAVLATRPLGVSAAAAISAVTNTGPVSAAAVVRLLRSTSIRIPVPERTAVLPTTVVAQIDATAKVFRNARTVTCNAYTDPGSRALSLTTAQATFACRRLRTDGLTAKTTANGHSAGHLLAPGVSEARRALSRRLVLRFGL